ncbi:MAG: S8 family serine peptidase [Candidatus Pacearchaeota archaeon]
MNKKWILGFIFVFILIGIFLVNSENIKENKIQKEVYENLEEETPVIIDVKENVDNSKIIDKLDNEARESGDLISVEVSKQELKELSENSDIEKISYVPKIKAFLQDAIPLMNVSNVWGTQINGVNITGIDETVCILDTGINFAHTDLTGKNKTCIIDCYNQDCVENCSVADDNGHGTHVAGIVAATGGIQGIGKNISLIGVKVLDLNGDAHETHGVLDIKNAIDWCIANRVTYNISVISMSLGTTNVYTTACDSTFSDTFTKSINNATYYNISVIVATGNAGSSIGIASPACIQNSTAVGATDKSDVVASYSNRNSLTDLFAIGSSINSTFAGGSCLIGCSCSGNYMICSGTSMATPMVAGAAALLKQFYRLQENRVAKPSEIQNLLNLTGKQIIDAGSGLTFSRIDVYSALWNITKIPSITSKSPANNYYINLANQNQTFICNTSSINYNLKNITFYLWNSTALVNKSNLSITGLTNSSIFYYNFTIEDSYKWDCVAYNIQNFSNTYSNYTIFYDLTKPVINLTSPANATTETSSNSITFSYNVSDLSVSNCSLIIDNVIDQTNDSIEVNSINSFTKTMSNGNYLWSVNCTDSANNINSSETRNLTVSYTAPVVNDNGGGGGGGGGSPKYKTFVVSAEQVSAGYSNTLSKDDKIKFVFFDSSSGEHTLTLNEVGTNYINITLRSNPINLKLGIGQSAKLNLTTSDYYDLYVKLNSISNSKADITIQTINEKIPNTITGNVVNEEDNAEKEKPTSENGKNYVAIIKDILLVILIIAVVVILSIKTNKKQEALKKYKEKFKEMKKK